jgi:lysophospholipase L1-like esterase
MKKVGLFLCFILILQFFAFMPIYADEIKTIVSFQSNEIWVSGNGTQTVDTVNTKNNTQSLKILQNSNSVIAGGLHSDITGSWDLSKYTNGTISSNNDYIAFTFYINNIESVDLSCGVSFYFGVGGYVDYYFTNIKSGLVTGWNEIYIQKSAIGIVGNPSWDGINTIRVRWDSLPNKQNEYVSFQNISLATAINYLPPTPTPTPTPTQTQTDGIFNSESGHYGVHSGEKAFTFGKFDSNNGWLATTNSEKWIKFNMPTGVIIGDSIAEGNPYNDGRLHTADGSTDLTYPNQKGQISWYLENFTKMKVYNHGIGGQTVAQVRQRWERDVLGQTVTFLPNTSMPYKASFVVVIAGINDIYQDRPVQDIKNDFDYIINSAIANNVFPIISNIPPETGITATRLQQLKEINTWLAQKTNIALIDLYSYFNDPNNDGNQKPGYGDGVHPTKYHYGMISKMIEKILLEKGQIPQYINMYTEFNFDDLLTNIARPKTINLFINELYKGTYDLNNSAQSFIEIPYNTEYASNITLQIIDIYNPYENPSDTLSYVGFSYINLSSTPSTPISNKAKPKE